MKKLLLITTAILFVFIANAQIVNIPDANFKAALLAHNPVIDTNGDGEIQVSEANVFTEMLNLEDKNITDLAGIEAFTSLTHLHCIANQLDTIDLSSNIALTFLNCCNNPILELNISNNINLTFVSCFGGQLTTLDLSNNTALTNLSCHKNQISTLDISNNLVLEYLYCYENELSSLDLGNNVALQGLFCEENHISSLDVSNNISLSNLYFKNNQLTNIDISNNPLLHTLNCDNNLLQNLDVSNNPLLVELNLRNNQISSLDISNNHVLTSITCQDNQLISLDASNNPVLDRLLCNGNQLISLNVKNGNNGNMNFGAETNPNLFCIEVDDPAWSTINWNGDHDLWSSFSDDCLYSIDSIEVNAGNDIYTICNESNQLNPTIIYNGSNSLSYSWSPSSGLSNSTILNPIANPTITTTYTITVTDGIETSIDSITIYVENLSMQEICMVTVDSIYEKNMIVWEKALLPIESYIIWKETYAAGSYNLLDTVPYNSPSIYVDMTSEPMVQSDKYKISTIDSCGNVSNMSPYHKTIHLNVSPITPQGYNLIWEHYEGYSFDTYIIYRKHNNNPFDSIHSIAYSPGVFSYTDVNPPVGNIYYSIVAQRLVPCDITQSGSKLEKTYSESMSNIVEMLNNNVNEISKIQCKIFPNPTTGKITVQAKDMERIEILDFTGKVIENLQGFRNLEGLDIDLSKNPKGIYIIKVTTQKGVAVEKIVLE